MATIRMKRGLEENIAQMPLLGGEIAVAMDTGRVYVGTESGNTPIIGQGGDMDAAIYDPTQKAQDIFAYAVPAAEKGVAGGVATLDESGKIPKAFLPEYSGGGTATGKKTVRFVIGTATAGWTEADCDYLCDGIDDQVEINAAIQALPVGGGELLLLTGTYDITSSILMNKENVKLCGQGYNTIIRRNFSNEIYNAEINIMASHVVVYNLLLDGNKSVYSSSMGISRGVERPTEEDFLYHVLIDTVYFKPHSSSCILAKFSKSLIQNCKFEGISGGSGLQITYSENVAVLHNMDVSNNSGISVSYSKNCISMGNIVMKAGAGNNFTECDNCIMAGNISVDCTSGISLTNTRLCTVTGCVALRGTGIPEDYTQTTSLRSIKISGCKKCTIVGNNFAGKDPVISDSTEIIVEGNKGV